MVKEFERIKVVIKKMSDSVQQKEANLKEYTDGIEKLKESWLPPLQQLIGKINKNFSYFLGELGCAGEISIKHGDNPVSMNVRCPIIIRSTR